MHAPYTSTTVQTISILIRKHSFFKNSFFRSSLSEVFIGKGVLKICSKINRRAPTPKRDFTKARPAIFEWNILDRNLHNSESFCTFKKTITAQKMTFSILGNLQ